MLATTCKPEETRQIENSRAHLRPKLAHVKNVHEGSKKFNFPVVLAQSLSRETLSTQLGLIPLIDPA